METTTKIGMFFSGFTIGYRLKKKSQKGRLVIMEGLKRYAEVKVIPLDKGLPCKDVQDLDKTLDVMCDVIMS